MKHFKLKKMIKELRLFELRNGRRKEDEEINEAFQVSDCGLQIANCKMHSCPE